MEQFTPKPFFDSNTGKTLIATAAVSAPVTVAGLITTNAVSASLKHKDQKQNSTTTAPAPTGQAQHQGKTTAPAPAEVKAPAPAPAQAQAQSEAAEHMPMMPPIVLRKLRKRRLEDTDDSRSGGRKPEGSSFSKRDPRTVRPRDCKSVKRGDCAGLR